MNEKLNTTEEDAGRSIHILPKKKISEELIKEYEELLNIKINQDDIIYLQVWQGCGTVSCHTIPIHKESEINQSIDDVRELAIKIYEFVKPQRNIFIQDDWYSSKKTDYRILEEKLPQFMKIYTIAGLLFIYSKCKEETYFKAGLILDKLKEIDKSYTENNKDIWYKYW